MSAKEIKPIFSQASKEAVVNMPGRIFLLFGLIIGVQSSTGPKLMRCKEKDFPCLTKTASVIYKRAIPGIPELNIENLDPLFYDVIQGDLTGLNYKLYNSTIEGSKNCDAVNMKLDLQKSKLLLDMNCPLLDMYGDYEVSGRILSIPISGNGDFTIKCKDYAIKLDTNIKVSERKDGKKYISLKSYQINSDLIGGMTIDLSNLFNGKQNQLAESVLNFMNKNWKPVVKELQAPVFNVNLKKLVKNFNKYLKSIPLDNILLD